MRQVGTAWEVLNPEDARTPAWYEARRAGITASEIATILGLSRFDSPLALYFRKRDELDEEPDNWRMELGRELEGYVLRCFTKATGVELEPCGLVVNMDRGWQLATPDAVSGGCPVEAKTALSEEDWGQSGSDVIPLYYRCQLLWQMDTLGADHGYLCVVFLRSGEPRWFRLDWDGEDIGVIRQAGLEFLHRLNTNCPPDADGSDATTKALRDRYHADEETPPAICTPGLRRSYIAALKARKLGDEKHKLAANKIRMAMGTATRLVDGDGNVVAVRRGPKEALYAGKDLV